MSPPTVREQRLVLIWRQQATLIGMCFFGLIAGLLAFAAVAVFAALFRSPEIPPWPVLLILALLGMAGIATPYAFVAVLMNRTTIQLGEQNLTVLRQPIPWTRISKVRRSAVANVLVQPHGRINGAPEQSVIVVTQDGRTMTLLHRATPHAAETVAASIKSWLPPRP
jgi:hypothetical protein